MPFVSDCISNLMSNGIFLELVRQDLDEVLDLLLQNDILDGSVVNQVCSLEKSFHDFFFKFTLINQEHSVSEYIYCGGY